MIYLFITIILFGIAIILFRCEPSLFFSPLIAVIIWIVYILFNLTINQDFRIFSTGALFIGYAISIFSLGSVSGLIFSNKYYQPINSFNTFLNV